MRRQIEYFRSLQINVLIHHDGRFEGKVVWKLRHLDTTEINENHHHHRCLMMKRIFKKISKKVIRKLRMTSLKFSPRTSSINSKDASYFHHNKVREISKHNNEEINWFSSHPHFRFFPISEEIYGIENALNGGGSNSLIYYIPLIREVCLAFHGDNFDENICLFSVPLRKRFPASALYQKSINYIENAFCV